MIEKKIAEIMEPLADEILSLKKQISEIKPIAGKDGEPGAPGQDGAPGRDGIGIKSVEMNTETKSMVLVLDNDQEIEVELPAGEKGEPGEPGRDGMGIETKKWEDGVYREGTIVTHEIGKFYKALRDTAQKPGGEDWERVGTAGFGWKGLKNPEASYENGDLYIDGGSTFIWWNGKGHMFVQRGARGAQGEKGIDGRDGKDAPYPITIKADTTGLHMVMSDGEVHSADINGLEEYVKQVTNSSQLYFLDQLYADIEQEGGTPIRAFKGTYMPNTSYSTGDVVTFNKALWVATKGTKLDYFDDQVWRKMFAGGGGGGGGGAGGIVQLSRVLIDRSLDMGGLSVYNIKDPRTGAVGVKDAVNRDTMEKAIAAGALYQGIYTVSTNNPDLSTKADVTVTPPAPGVPVNAPAAAPGMTNSADILVWHNWKGNGFDTFAVTTTAPRPLSVMLSNGHIAKANIPPGVYADANALKAALKTAFAAEADITDFFVYVNGADCWIGVQTAAPVYCTAISNETGHAFPDAVPGKNNQILNTYNWIVQTQDENTPEALPEGLPGLPAGTIVKNSDVLQWSGAKNGFEVISGSSLTQNFSDQRYWQINGNNMAWEDQAYNKNSIVYGTRFNAWFTATQNVPAGSAEPGTLQAAAIWRKINSTYGATVFFGKGDYDTGNTTAANNWGMPAGTYPSGQQPLNGDSYFDVTTGTITEFAVTQTNPVYTISETVNTANAPLGNLTRGDLDIWPPISVRYPNRGAFYKATAPGNYTITGGVFTGMSTVAGKDYYVVSSGDPDSDNNGWVLVPSDRLTWTTNTPHAQVVPDVIVPTVVYGYRRNFSITLNNTLAVDAKPVLLHNIPATNGILKVEIRDKQTTGSVYEFEILTSDGAPVLTNPIAIKAHNSHFKLISAGWTPALGVLLTATLTADAHGRTFDISIESVDYSLAGIRVGDGTQVESADSSHFEANRDYPGQALIDFMKGVASGQYSPFGVSTTVLPADPTTGAKPISRGSWFVTTTNANAAGWSHTSSATDWRIGMDKAAGKNSCPIPAALRVSTNFFRVTVNVIMNIAPANINYNSQFTFEDGGYRMDKSSGTYWSGGSGDAMTKTGSVIVQGDSNAFDWWNFAIMGSSANGWSLRRVFVTYELLNI